MAREKKQEFDKFRFDLAYKLRSIREAQNYTIDDMAKRLNTSPATITHYESGRETPNLLYLYEVAKFGGVTLDDLAIASRAEFLKKLFSFG